MGWAAMASMPRGESDSEMPEVALSLTENFVGLDEGDVPRNDGSFKA